MAIYNTDEDPNVQMWQEQQDAIAFNSIIEGMESNGYAYFDEKEFLAKSGKPCYVPENADCVEEVFSYQDLKRVVADWLKYADTIETLKDKGYTEKEILDVDAFVYNLYHSLEWQFPSTLLDEWTY